MARRKKLFSVRKPRLRVTSKGFHVRAPSARVGGKIGVNISKSGFSSSVRTGHGSYNTRRGFSTGLGCPFTMGLVLFLVAAAMLGACSNAKESVWQTSNVLDVFRDAGLEVESPRPMTKDDYGLAPYIATEGTHFLIPSLCEDCGGRIFSFEDQDDLATMREYYVSLGESSAMFFSWTFTRDNILVQINGDLPEEQAKQYEAALQAME